MFLIVFLMAAAARAQTAELAIVNATIYTGIAGRPPVRAMAIQGDRILAAGDDVRRYIGKTTRVMDLRGATIIPGLIDAHGHMRGLGESLQQLDLRRAASPAEAVEAVRRAAAARPAGSWIIGRGWDQTRWPSGEFPDAEALSAASPRHPVFLTRVDGHAAWVNRLALESAGIGPDTPDPPGGRIIRDRQGKPTGILVDRAVSLVSRRIPPPGPQQVREQLARAAQECARLGLTGVHDAGVGAVEIDAYRELIAANRLPVRIYAMIGGDGQLWQSYLKRGPETGAFLTVRSIKLLADGALGSRGAAMKQDYSDEAGNRGLLILSRGEIARIARQAVEAGFQVNTHAIGDRANFEVLMAYAEALGGPNDQRFRVEHAQIVSPEDFALFRRYSVIASIQATHATSDMRWAGKRIGPLRMQGAYAWQSFLKLGVPLANGSDFPVESPNPLWGFYASITRQDHAGLPAGGWMPEQRLEREQALHSWTLGAAYAAFEEKQKGTLEAGKLADFVVLSQDIMRIPPLQILETRVTMTVVGGKVVYQE